jgi:hypothetical protein
LNLAGFILQLLPADIQHIWGDIQPGDGNALSSSGQEHTACPTTDLQYGSAGLNGFFDEEVDVWPLPVGDNMVIKLSYDWVGLITAGVLAHVQLLVKILISF